VPPSPVPSPAFAGSTSRATLVAVLLVPEHRQLLWNGVGI